MDLLLAVVFIFLLILSGFLRTKHVREESSYLLADRKTHFFPLLATLVMTEFNTSTLLGFSAVGYSAGVWGLTLPLVFWIGLWFYTFTVARQWKRMNGLSVAELFTRKYGTAIGKTASAFLLLAMLGFSATYVKSIAMIFHPLFGELRIEVLSFALVFLVLFITLRGGLVSVIQTDMISFVAALVLIPALLFAAKGDHNWLELAHEFALSDSQKALPPSFVLSLILLTMFTYIAAPWYGQKIFSAKDEKTAFLSILVAAVLVFLLYSFPLLATAFLKVRGANLSNPETSIPYILDNLMPVGIRGIGYAVLFSITATTLSGVWNAMTTMVVGDFLAPAKSGIGRSVWITLGFALLSYLLAITLVDAILQKLILANIPVFALSFALLAGFHWKRVSKAGAIVSMLVGLFWGVFCYVYFGEAGGYTFYWSTIGLALVFGSGIVFSLVFPDTQKE